MLPDWIQPPEPGMKDPLITYHEDGVVVKSISYLNANGYFHRLDGPAKIRWNKDGIKIYEEWLRHGRTYRENDLPTAIMRHDNGMLRGLHWYRGNIKHRDKGAAEIWIHPDGTLNYCQRFIDGELILEGKELLAKDTIEELISIKI